MSQGQTVQFWGLKTCDTCRKASRALEAAGLTVETRDVRADGVPTESLERWVAQMGWETLLNTRSTTWRGLADTDKADLDTQKAVALMLNNPTLIKRPVIETNDTLLVGWTKDVQSALGL
ncbi:MAG: Spx/MgsR family RNA polymerase-binding regulatory protein [Pseudomonadota bacterium]